MRFLPLLALLALLLAASCGESERPDNLVKEDTYIDLLVEFQLAQSYQQSLPPDSVVIDSLNKAILDKYGITPDQFRESHQYYERQLKQQNERISEAIDRLKMEMVKVDTVSRGQ